MDYNTKQVAVVTDSRRAWWRGFRESAMAADIRRKRLIDTLESTIPEHSFRSGVVNTGEARTDWEGDDLSGPCDIIVHTGKPWEEMEDYVTVPSSGAHCLIEVESWLSADDLSGDGGINDRIATLQDETGLPVFLVAFRHSGPKSELVSASVADETLILASGGTEKTAELIYEGALENLVDLVRATTEYDG